MRSRWRCSACGAAIASALVAIIFHVSPEAAACSCASLSFELWPRGEEVPRNAHVFMEISVGGWRSPDPKKVELTLIDPIPGRIIAAKQKRYISKNRAVVELIPKRPLPPDTTFEVHYTDGQKAGSAGRFKTGKRSDRQRPRFPAIGSATFHHDEAVCCNCTSGKPYIELESKSAAGQTFFAVWRGKAGKVDWKRPPDLIESDYKGKIWLGYPSICGTDNFAIDKPGTTMTLGVRTLDIAGNWSREKHIVNVKVLPKKRRPVPKPTPKPTPTPTPTSGRTP